MSQTNNDLGQRLDQSIADFSQLADQALNKAKSLGSDEAQFVASMSAVKKLVVENKQFSLANSIEKQSLGLGVHCAQKNGTAATNDMSAKSVESAVEDAVALAKFSVPDPALIYADESQAPKASDLGFLFDSTVFDLDLGKMKEVMDEGLVSLTRDKRVAVDRFEVSIQGSTHFLANSHGVRQAEKQTLVSWDVMGMAVDGEQVTGVDYDVGFSFKGAELKSGVDQMIARFVEKIVRSLNPRSCPTYKGPVIFSPRAFEEVILDTILYQVSGASIMDQKSRWGDKLESKVADKLFSVLDQPHDASLMGSTAYDSYGVPTKALTILDEGVLKSHLHDCYTAKRCEATTTGSGGGPFAIQVAAGEHSFKDLMGLRKEILFIDRFSGNGDPITGDFSGVAKSSRLYVDGEDAGAVDETMIAGNVFELLAGSCQATSSRDNVMGQFLCPTIALDGVSVTGGG